MNEITSDLRIILCSAVIGVRKMFRSAAFWLLALYTLMFWFLYAVGLREMAAEYGYGVTPFLLPLFFDDDIYGMYGQLMLCLVACNAPFLDRGSLFTLHRTGRTAWGIAQMIYIVLANIIFMAVMMVTQMIFLFPHLTFSSRWGSVLYTLANLPEIRSKYGGYGSFEASIILGMNPTAALGMQLVLCLLLGSVIGALIFLINGLTRSTFGGVVAVGCVIFTNWISWGMEVRYVSPFEWMKLSNYLNGVYDFKTNVIRLALMFAVLAVACCVCVKRQWIRTTD
ncbi:MAG: hypothetical protein LUE29_14055 [Lachnospiraceae bacterium]|nr:hypothetical protein [Lachnospiraceae bacterium]